MHSGIKAVLFFVIASVLLGFILLPDAFAIDIGDKVGGPSTLTDDIQADGPSSNTFTIPQTVKYDPTKGPWIKVLDVTSGGTFPIKKIIEPITVAAGSPDITDWHQVLLPNTVPFPGQAAQWINCPPENAGDPTPPRITGPGFQVDGVIMSSQAGFTDDAVWFDFPPVSQGMLFTVEKCLAIIEAQALSITISQFPTCKSCETVGGELIPLDNVSLILAYGMVNSWWMAPIGIGIGLGIYLVKRRF